LFTGAEITGEIQAIGETTTGENIRVVLHQALPPGHTTSHIQTVDHQAAVTITEVHLAPSLHALNRPEAALLLEDPNLHALSLAVQSLHVGLNRTDQTQVAQLVGQSLHAAVNLIQSPEGQVVLLEDQAGIRREVKGLRPQVAIATEDSGGNCNFIVVYLIKNF